MQLTTLCLLVRDNEILLAMKKRGFGIGRWNGVGGKVGKKESIEEAALREMEEEIGVKANLENLEKIGNIKFYFGHKPDWNQHMHIFFVRDWSGEPKESEEMAPKWYKYEEVPFGEMWSSDTQWLPKVLEGKKIEGEFYYIDDGDNFEKFDLREI